jgi:hypothetical protein
MEEGKEGESFSGVDVMKLLIGYMQSLNIQILA